MSHVPLRHALQLVKHGLSEDTAFSLSPSRRIAYNIIFAEIENNQEFNFSTMKFEERKEEK